MAQKKRTTGTRSRAGAGTKTTSRPRNASKNASKGAKTARTSASASRGGSISLLTRARVFAGRAGSAASVAYRGVIVVVIGGVVLAWAIGRGPLEDRLAAERMDPVRVSVPWPPAVADGDSRPQDLLALDAHAMLNEIASATVSPDPFDQASLETARALMLRTGWLSQVPEVRRNPRNHISIEASWRREAAVVALGRPGGGSDLHVIARDGTPLALPPGSAIPRDLYMITNPVFGPERTDDGSIDRTRPWPGGGLRAAIELLDTISRLPIAGAVTGIDLSAYRDRGHLVVLTDRGSRLVWGSPLGTSTPGEADDTVKLGHLRRALSAGDRLDAPGTPLRLYTPTLYVDRSPGGSQ